MNCKDCKKKIKKNYYKIKENIYCVSCFEKKTKRYHASFDQLNCKVRESKTFKKMITESII